MARQRRVFHKRPPRRTSWQAIVLSLAALAATAPAAVPKTPSHMPTAQKPATAQQVPARNF
jgi:hypothetical protein